MMSFGAGRWQSDEAELSWFSH